MFITNEIGHFFNKDFNYRGIKFYSNDYLPTFVIGLYKDTTKILDQNKSLRVLILSGSDRFALRKNVKKFPIKYLSNPKIKYIHNVSFV